jgi:hypothetical protein
MYIVPVALIKLLSTVMEIHVESSTPVCTVLVLDCP